MLVTLSGIMTEEMFELLEKALSPIPVTLIPLIFVGITTFVSLPLYLVIVIKPSVFVLYSKSSAGDSLINGMLLLLA